MSRTNIAPMDMLDQIRRDVDDLRAAIDALEVGPAAKATYHAVADRLLRMIDQIEQLDRHRLRPH